MQLYRSCKIYPESQVSDKKGFEFIGDVIYIFVLVVLFYEIVNCINCKQYALISCDFAIQFVAHWRYSYDDDADEDDSTIISSIPRL